LLDYVEYVNIGIKFLQSKNGSSTRLIIFIKLDNTGRGLIYQARIKTGRINSTPTTIIINSVGQASRLSTLSKDRPLTTFTKYSYY